MCPVIEDCIVNLRVYRSGMCSVWVGHARLESGSLFGVSKRMSNGRQGSPYPKI